jgi:hypothetical protein
MRDINPASEMDEDEERDHLKLGALRAAVKAGKESGVAEGEVFEEVPSYIRQLAAEEVRN